MRRVTVLLLAIVCSAMAAHAQFGGRPGDVVLYVLTAKGSGDFQAVPGSTTNTQTGFVIENPNDLPLEPFGPDFPSEFRHKMHGEDGDVFNMIIQNRGHESPHQLLQGPVKVFLIAGLLRLEPADEEPTDTTPGLYVPFPSSIDFGPNTAVFEGHYLLWTPFPSFPVAKKTDPSYRSPVVPAEYKSGVDYLLAIGTFCGIVPWVGMDKQYPGVGWKQGIDTRWIDNDPSMQVTVRQLRLRQGRKTPMFRINANTHIWVLQGKVTITPAGGTPTVMHKDIYAFVPPGYTIQLSNPADYTGPLDDNTVVADKDTVITGKERVVQK